MSGPALLHSLTAPVVRYDDHGAPIGRTIAAIEEMRQAFADHLAPRPPVAQRRRLTALGTVPGLVPPARADWDVALLEPDGAS